jgi:hypothetical protein
VFLSDDADVERLLDEGPDVLIHGHFLITVAAYALGCSW